MYSIEERKWAIEQALVYARIVAEFSGEGSIGVDATAERFLHFIHRDVPKITPSEGEA